ncbi:MAG: Gldg family protein, partial [Thermoguttaceae bacterium]
IEAYISSEVPKPYAQTRLNIISTLKEFESIDSKNISVRIHEIQPNTEAALIAAERYGIQPREVWYETQGNRSNTRIFLGVVFRCGLRTLTLPFIDRGLSPEYELVHALCSVTDPQKKRIGIVKTDVPLFGFFSMETMSMSPEMRIISELRKRYNVVEVDPTLPIMEYFDALLAVQPSTLDPGQMQNFVMAIRRGQPTIIFEDPLPYHFLNVVSGTNQPRRQQNQMMMMPRNLPKGDISLLWRMLGIDFNGSDSVWQDYNPIRKLESSLPKGVVFLDKAKNSKTKEFVSPFAQDDPITLKLQYMMLPFPGSMKKVDGVPLDYKPLLWTIYRPSGLALVEDSINAFLEVSQFDKFDERVNRPNRVTEGPKEIAVHITGELPPLPISEGASSDQANADKSQEPIPLNVVVVADIDLLANNVFTMQEQGNPLGLGINLDFENVPFILNTIDSVAGDDRFLEIRTRRPVHRTLKRIDDVTDAVRQRTAESLNQLKKNLDEELAEESEKFNSEIENIRDDMRQKGIGQEEAGSRLLSVIDNAQRKIKIKEEKHNREMRQQTETANIEINEFVHKVQGQYKFYAVVLPPIPPLLIGLVVYTFRRFREYEGVPKTRRKNS